MSQPSTVSSYTVLANLGSGTFGRVSKVQRHSDQSIHCWKEINFANFSEQEKKLLVQEVNILREISHPFIVRYTDRIIDKANKTLYIVMEYCSGGDLAHKIQAIKKHQIQPFDESTIWQTLGQICSALHSCHTRTPMILHRDIKPQNIFLDAQNNVKLGDFGLARVLSSESEYAQTQVGTPYYQSPEQVTDSHYNAKSDVWSLGCLIYEMCALSPPFKANTHYALAVKIQAGEYERIPADYTTELEYCIRSMLQLDSSKRPSCEQLLALPRVQAAMQQVGVKRPATAVPVTSTTITQQHLQQQKQLLDTRERQLIAKEQMLFQREAELNALAVKLAAAAAAQTSASAHPAHHHNHGHASHQHRTAVPVQPSPPAPFTKLSNITNSTANIAANTPVIGPAVTGATVSAGSNGKKFGSLTSELTSLALNSVQKKQTVASDNVSPRIWSYE